MSRTIILDGGPLGVVTNPKPSIVGKACTEWLQSHLHSGSRIIIPEIVDYELRRELLRADKMKGIAQLDELARLLEYVPLTTTAMRRAAQLWADARKVGRPTAGDRTIDADMILAGQALTLGVPGVIVATTNVGHLARVVPADLWQNIRT